MLAQADFVPGIPIGEAAEGVVDFVTENFSGFFSVLENVIELFVDNLLVVLTFLPPLAMLVVFSVLAFLLAGWRVALVTALGLLLVVSMEVWEETMTTLALVFTSVVIAIALAVPLGILAAQFRTVETITTPVLDFMQTLPPFVYLIPASALLGLGNPPALLVTVVFAIPPGVRLTMLGIQQVSKETVEAAYSFGATRWQTLVKVELPQALTTIMAGVNQVIMLALSMVVIAALIGAGGLGEQVFTGLSQLDLPAAIEAGLGIVIIAIILDRVTRNVGQSREGGGAKSKV